MTLRELCRSELRARGRDEEHIDKAIMHMERMSQRMRDVLDRDITPEEQASFSAVLEQVYTLPLSVSKEFVTKKLIKDARNQ